MRWSLPASARVEATMLHDGHTVAVRVRNVGDGVPAPVPPPGCRTRQVGPADREALLYVTCTAEVASASWQGGTAAGGAGLRLGLRDGLTVLREAVRSPLPAPLAAGEDVDALRGAERLLSAGDWDAAELHFNALRASYPSASWAQLRLADVAAGRGQRDAACAAYVGVGSKFGSRTTGIVARLRAQLLDCPGHASIDAAALLRRGHADDATGTLLSSEARRVLRFERDPAAVGRALALGRTALGEPLWSAMLARQAFGLAPMALAGLPLPATLAAAWPTHPDMAHFEVLRVLALCDLDLATAAREQVQARGVQLAAAALARCLVADRAGPGAPPRPPTALAGPGGPAPSVAPASPGGPAPAVGPGADAAAAAGPAVTLAQAISRVETRLAAIRRALPRPAAVPPAKESP